MIVIWGSRPRVPATEGKSTLKKDPLTHGVTTQVTDMTFLPPGKPPRADTESRMRAPAKARADRCAKNDGHYFGPGTEHTPSFSLSSLDFQGHHGINGLGSFLLSFCTCLFNLETISPGACGGFPVLLQVLGIIGRPQERVFIRRRRQHRTHSSSQLKSSRPSGADSFKSHSRSCPEDLGE